MNPSEVLYRLRRAGITLSPNSSGGLHYAGPAGAMTPELRFAVSQNKHELVIYLHAQSMTMAEEADLRIALLAAAAEAAFPRLTLRAGETVIGGLGSWTRFVKRAAPESLLRAESALSQHKATLSEAAGAPQMEGAIS
jgi:hypothetical protein